jgi:hypothetical protein
MKSECFPFHQQSSHVCYAGYAFVEPPADLRACFDEMERCGKILQQHRPKFHEIYVKKSCSLEPSSQSPASRPHDLGKRIHRSCTMLATVNAALSKITSQNSKAFDIATCATPCAQQCVLAQLKEQFPWIEMQDVLNHPTAQALADHMTEIEASQRECREFLENAGGRAARKTAQNSEGASQSLSHTELRCLDIRVECCARHACSILDKLCQ